MATFALFYKRQDVTAIAAEVSNPGLTPQEKNTANRYWNGGLKDWSTAPQAPQVDPYGCVTIPFEPIPGEIDPDKTWTQNPDGTWLVCDPTMLIIVVSGAQVSKQGLVDFLRLIGNKYPGALYMLAIADDVANTAVEPWTG